MIKFNFTLTDEEYRLRCKIAAKKWREERGLGVKA
jgi:hypothetical protein